MAIVIPYTKQTWTDDVSDCSAARNNVHEDGINDAHYMPCVRVTKAAAQTGIVTATITALTFDTERIDQAGNVASTMHDNSTNPTRLTCRHAGVYCIGGSCRWSASPTTGTIFVRLNGATNLGDITIVADFRNMAITIMYPLAVNDYVELMVQQQSGSNKDIEKQGNYSPEFWMFRCG